MKIYIYCPRKSQGALELVQTLGAKRLRRFDGMDFWDKQKRFELAEGDIVVCWGAHLPELDGVKVLNALDRVVNKSDELTKLVQAGIPTVRAYKSVPRGVDRSLVFPRIAEHTGGQDLLHTPAYPDYYILKEDFVREYRIHSFNGKSIRAGQKEVRPGFTLVQKAEDWKPNANLAHPWVRSYDGGWRINYDGFKSTAKMRGLAHNAVKALGLTFGAVDIGETANGILKVLEVNRAPGLEGNTVQSYARAITKWIAPDPQQPKQQLPSEQDPGLD